MGISEKSVAQAAFLLQELQGRPIILIGPMGAGKTTVGRRLARSLARGFFDADEVVESRCGVPIRTIFEIEGEAGFRLREQRILDELTQLPSTVVATGGGAVVSPENRSMLGERGWVILLRVAEGELWRRVHNDRGRPLLQTDNARDQMRMILRERLPLYLETAHQVVESGHRSVGAMVSSILGGFREAFEEGKGTGVAGDFRI